MHLVQILLILAAYNTNTAFFDVPRLTYDCESLGVSKVDEEFDICLPSAYKIRRLWHVIDWCNSNFDISHLQVIKVQDIEQPEIFVNGDNGPDKNDPNAPATHSIFGSINTNDNDCEMWLDILATATDNCSDLTITNNSPLCEYRWRRCLWILS